MTAHKHSIRELLAALEEVGATELANDVRAEIRRLRQESKRYRLELRAAEEKLAHITEEAH